MSRFLEFFADQEDNFLKTDKERKDWQLSAIIAKRQINRIANLDAYSAEFLRNPREEQDPNKRERLQQKVDNLKRDAEKEPLAAMRKWYLQKYFLRNVDGDGRGEACSRVCTHLESFKAAGLNPQSPKVSLLPSGSATLTLTFRLLTPLLTKDDDPFHLFDNPVRRDHIFGVPYLSAAGVKGLAADAYQRAFPGAANATSAGENEDEDENAQARTLRYRLDDRYALRLFGLADDGVKAESEDHRSRAGRLHFSPVWFPAVQYIILNPTDPQTGLGAVPIQFEAIAPHLPNGTPVEAELRVFYFNPHGAPDSEETTVRGDLARWLAALANWWPVLGLGAKRLAGYGAIEPTAAVCHAKDWKNWNSAECKGKESWMTLAERIAEGA